MRLLISGSWVRAPRWAITFPNFFLTEYYFCALYIQRISETETAQKRIIIISPETASPVASCQLGVRGQLLTQHFWLSQNCRKVCLLSKNRRPKMQNLEQKKSQFGEIYGAKSEC